MIQSGTDSKIDTDFTPNLELDGPYEIALHSLETYYSFADVDETDKNAFINISRPCGHFENHEK